MPSSNGNGGTTTPEPSFSSSSSPSSPSPSGSTFWLSLVCGGCGGDGCCKDSLGAGLLLLLLSPGAESSTLRLRLFFAIITTDVPVDVHVPRLDVWVCRAYQLSVHLHVTTCSMNCRHNERGGGRFVFQVERIQPGAIKTDPSPVLISGRDKHSQVGRRIGHAKRRLRPTTLSPPSL